MAIVVILFATKPIKRKRQQQQCRCPLCKKKKLKKSKKEEKGRSLPSSLSSCHWAEAPISNFPCVATFLSSPRNSSYGCEKKEAKPGGRENLDLGGEVLGR